MILCLFYEWKYSRIRNDIPFSIEYILKCKSMLIFKHVKYQTIVDVKTIWILIFFFLVFTCDIFYFIWEFSKQLKTKEKLCFENAHVMYWNVNMYIKKFQYPTGFHMFHFYILSDIS